MFERRRGVQPQLYADNLKCVSGDLGVLLRAARFTAGYVRLVGQGPAPSQCVLMSTSRAVRRDRRRWVVTDEGDRWSVKLDVRDLGGRFDSTFRVGLLPWSAHLCSPLDFHRLRVIRPCLFLVLRMVLRLLFLLRPVCASCGLLLLRLFGLAVSLLQILVRC